MSAVRSALAAAHLRFRPIIMTSLAFSLGVLPLAIASGAGSASQRAIGTGVMGGILVGTTLAVFFVPAFFVVVRHVFKGSARQRERYAEHAQKAGLSGDTASRILHDAEQGLPETELRALDQDEGRTPPNAKDPS